MKNPDSGRFLIGLLFILIGGILFLRISNLEMPFDLPHYLFKWPMILIILGVYFFFSRENRFTGIILFLIGGAFLSKYIFEVSMGTVIQFAIPILLVASGIMLLFPRTFLKKKRFSESRTSIKDNRLKAVHIFSDGSNLIESESFEGGEIVCIFGDSDIIFSKSITSPGKVILDIVCIFGGCTVYVPEEWTVRTDISNIFADIKDKRHQTGSIINIDPEKVLNIKGSLLFSGLKIRKT